MKQHITRFKMTTKTSIRKKISNVSGQEFATIGNHSSSFGTFNFYMFLSIFFFLVSDRDFTKYFKKYF